MPEKISLRKILNDSAQREDKSKFWTIELHNRLIADSEQMF